MDKNSVGDAMNEDIMLTYFLVSYIDNPILSGVLTGIMASADGIVSHTNAMAVI